MFYKGQNVRSSPPEKLQRINIEELVSMIQNKDSALAVETSRLRKVGAIDPRVFKKLKLGLPYFIAADFSENIRNTDNFIAIHAIIIDFDDCLKTPTQSQTLIAEVCKHSEVLCCFVSPSGKGLKVIFKLQEPLCDIGLYKRFYIDFARQFAERIRLLGTLDTRTIDPTRVCFMIHDSRVHYNPNASPLNWQLWAEKNPEKQTATSNDKAKLSPEIHQELLRLVNPKAPPKPPITPYIPKLLAEIENKVKNCLASEEITVIEVVKIQYGLKFCCKKELELSEIIVFYGKRGFSVVKSAKSSISAQLNDKVYSIIFECIFDQLPNASKS